MIYVMLDETTDYWREGPKIWIGRNAHVDSAMSIWPPQSSSGLLWEAVQRAPINSKERFEIARTSQGLT
jgi:hypothetical protein